MRHKTMKSTQDYPLSYVEWENGRPVGKGVAFKVLEFLTEKFNFTINIVPLEKNIIGSKVDYAGSLVQVLNESVRTNFQQRHFNAQKKTIFHTRLRTWHAYSISIQIESGLSGSFHTAVGSHTQSTYLFDDGTG